MNNTLKYTSLVDYSIKLSNSIGKIETAFWSKPPKQMGSLNVTLKNIEEIIKNIKKIQQMQSDMKKITTLDLIAKKDNRSARKVEDQISSIKADLSDIYAKLKDDFFKQMKIAGEQCREVGRAIKDKEERARFSEASKDFELMAFESKTSKHRIPLNEKNELEQLKQSKAKEEHDEKEKRIDSVTNFELQDTDKLETALRTLTIILAVNSTDDLSMEVRNEVAQIKKVLPPKTMSITKENLERLRHSSHLLVDLEQISEILNTTHSFTGKDGKLQKINKKLEALKPLLEQAIKEERKKNMDIKKEYEEVQSKVDYATDAVKTYGDILDGNTRLEKEQIQIRNNSHILQTENDRLKKDETKAYDEAKTIQMKPIDRQDWNDALNVDQLYERAKKDAEMIKENERYMADKMYERPTTELPFEYTNMKKRLQSVSSLYNMQISQELTGGAR